MPSLITEDLASEHHNSSFEKAIRDIEGKSWRMIQHEGDLWVRISALQSHPFV